MSRPPEKEQPRGEQPGKGLSPVLIVLALLVAAVIGAVGGALWLGDALVGVTG